MNSIFAKLRDFIGLNQPVDYDYEYDEMDREGYHQNIYQEQPPAPPPPEERQNRTRLREQRLGATSTGMMGTGSGLGATMNNVIGLPGATNGISEVLVMEPRSFEEMPQAIQALRERKSVVLNLTLMDPDQAQRAVDFIAGGTYALDGHQERIGESIFLFTPSCVQVSTQTGVVHDVLQPHLRGSRPAGQPTTANWSAESARMAQ
ncbi:MAG: cell division protein SepF [Oscillatoriaceae bacterium SKW80]|nr:cell division protein SepF [Oscillatoriaceae bacterium SKYG93]MCX8121656.1 cell division protein SepF [Oscillatoriaceae bacterium SKW80]MDW8453964.1 cell division protein SepF [Oscillatoriaceae cyanobacterium SKYGB_i_bin93]HIK28791.1 cell division protein SepF [Oscillatoriaceae cyanobacterium M7585_C2015_266]